MNHTEHNEAVHTATEKMVKDQISHWPRYNKSDKALRSVMDRYWTQPIQHIIVTHYGYNKPVEETAKAVSDRLIEMFHQAESVC
jgi:hypothetical protein